MFYVYAVQNEQTGKIYIGQTADLERRLKRHNQELSTKKSSFTTKHLGNWKYIYIEECNDRPSALLREKQLKTAKGRGFIKNMGQ